MRYAKSRDMTAAVPCRTSNLWPRVSSLWVLALACVGPCISWGTASAQEERASTIILDTNGYWRNYFVLSPPVVRDGAELKRLPMINGPTPLPPKDWTTADFDDSGWARTPGRPLPVANILHQWYQIDLDPAVLDAGICVNEKGSPALAMLCMRGRFTVTDPTAAKDLSLSLRYRGGVIVYVNGREVGRSHMARDAAGPDALAEDYPREAFFRDDGAPCCGAEHNKPAIEVKAWKARIRQAEILIPLQALRKGVNVLALELHRTALPPGVANANIGGWNTAPQGWSTCGLLAARLTAATATGLVPNCSRPEGFQVWSSQLMQPDFDLDYGDPNEPLRPVRIVGSPGGVFSGKVVVGCDRPIKGLTAHLRELSTGKGASIAGSTVKVRYAMPTTWEPIMPGRYPHPATLMDGLADSAPAEVPVRGGGKVDPGLTPPGQPAWRVGAVCPIWVTVAVPQGTAAGVYKGALTVAAEGLDPVQVPVELTVSSWRVPKPSTFHTFVDLIESPESVALQYNVPLYGEKHWQLLEKSFERLGSVGNWTVHIPLICQTNQGNEQSMVRWIRKPDGTYKYDFTVFDRYLDLAEKYMGKPRIVNLVVWDKFVGATLDGHGMIKASVGGPEEIPVSLLDEATGEVSMTTVGRYDQEGKARWKALKEEIQARLRKRGLEKSAVLGTAMDCFPSKEVLAFWDEVWPELSWGRYSHMETGTIPGTKRRWGFESGMSFFNSVPGLAAPVNRPFYGYGWKRPDVHFWFFRTPTVSLPWDFCRLIAEIGTQGPKRGFGRMGLDFWPVLKNAKGEPTGQLLARYPKSSWLQLDMIIKVWAPPGPDGAMGSGKLEMLREGLEENEARILLESVLIDPELKAKVPAPLAARCEQVLQERIRALTVNLEMSGGIGFMRAFPWLDGQSSGMYDGREAGIFRQWYMASGWQERSKKLFDVAAEAADQLK